MVHPKQKHELLRTTRKMKNINTGKKLNKKAKKEKPPKDKQTKKLTTYYHETDIQ